MKGRRIQSSRVTLMLKVLAHPLRAEILGRIIRRPSSPTELSGALGASVGVVDYHMRRLEDAGLARLVKRERTPGRRGHPQKYYAAEPLQISDQEWMRVPDLVRAALTDAALRELAAKAGAARAAEDPDDDGEASDDALLALVRDELVGMLGMIARSLLDVAAEAEVRTDAPSPPGATKAPRAA